MRRPCRGTTHNASSAPIDASRMPPLPRSMLPVSRRAFLGTLAAAIPAAAVVRRAHAAAIDGLGASTGALHALGDAVLPSELGRDGTARVVRDFQRWIAGYREGAELLHGYGTSRLERAGPTPATRWMQQLDALEAAARARRGRAASFASLPVDERRQLVRRVLDDLKATRIGPVGRAPHVALALLGHYYASSEATDRCYGAHIGRQQCRPLAASPRRPLPIAGART